MKDLHDIISSNLKENIIKFNSLFDDGLKDFKVKNEAEKLALK